MIPLVELFAKEFIQPADFKEACDKGIVKDGNLIVSTEVTGIKDGKQVRHTIYAISTLRDSVKHLPWANHMSLMVGFPAVIASLMLGRGEIKKKGVGCAWLIEQPGAFLKKMEDKGIQLLEKIEKSFS